MNYSITTVLLSSTKLLWFFLSFQLSAQVKEKVSVYFEHDSLGFAIYVDNSEYCPVSVKTSFILENLKAKKDTSYVSVVPARVTKYKINELSPVITESRSEFKVNSKWQKGNVNSNAYNENYPYYLPYEKNKSYKLFQGYNGKSSHVNKHSLDFTMSIGSKVHAARNGVVIALEESNTLNCFSEDCVRFNNFVVIYHNDGTFAQYAHLVKDGVLVALGDEVEKGQLIAKSGNTGYSSGPHLHFNVYLQKFDSIQTVRTSFIISGEKELILLKEGKKYKRSY